MDAPDIEQLDIEDCVIDHSYLRADQFHLAYAQWTHHRPHGGTATLLEDTPIPATGPATTSGWNASPPGRKSSPRPKPGNARRSAGSSTTPKPPPGRE